MSLFKGVATALITPFKHGKVDLDALDALLERQIAAGVAAVVVNGTTGEPSTMSHAERTKVISRVISRANGRIKVIAGAGINNTHTAIDYAKEAEQLGADAILSVTPYYNKCTQKGLVAHYTEQAKHVSLPIILYNVPGRTGVNILPQTAKELAEIDNIVAIKEASGNIEQVIETARLTQGKMDVYSGDDGLVVPMMAAAGALGVISVASNVFPELMVEMCDAYFKGNVKKARDIQFRISPAVKALFAEVNPIPVKYAASILGICENELRLPLTPMEKTELIDSAFRDLGLIK